MRGQEKVRGAERGETHKWRR